MDKIRLFLFAVMLILCISLWSDIPTPQSHCKSQSYIKGFRKIPTTFYLVQTTGIPRKLTFTKIVTDVVTVSSGTLYFAQFISWDPEFKKLQEGEEYNLADTGIKLYDEADLVRDKSIDHKKAMTLTAYCPKYQEFDKIDSYYEIRESNPASAKNDLKYSLAINKRIFKDSQLQIIETGDFDKFQTFLNKRQTYSEQIHPSYNVDEVVSYARKLKDHKVRMGPSVGSTNDDPINVKDNSLQNPDQAKYPPRKTINQISKAMNAENSPDMRIFKRNFIRALIYSILIEFLVLLILFKPVTLVSPFKLEQFITIFITCAAATGFTISINWWIFPAFINQYLPNLIATELFAVIVEALVYAKVFKISFKNALILSVACNFNSYIAGVLQLPYLF